MNKTTKLLAIYGTIAVIVGQAASECVNPTSLDLSSDLILESHLNTELVVGLSSGDSTPENYTALIDDFVTAKNYTHNLLKGDHVEKTKWTLECNGDSYLLRHAYFTDLCAKMIDPVRFPFRRFVRLDRCDNEAAANDILKFTFQNYDSDTGFAQLKMGPKETELDTPEDGLCLTLSACFSDERASCDPEPVPNNKEAVRGNMFTMYNCDRIRGQLFKVGEFPQHHIPTVSPTKEPTSSPIPHPTASPTTEVVLSITESPTGSPTSAATEVITESPTEAATSNGDDVVDDSDVISRDGDADDVQNDGLSDGIIALIVILILLFLILVAYLVAKKKQSEKPAQGGADPAGAGESAPTDMAKV